MKKLHLLLLLLPFMVEAQTNVEYISTTRIIGEGEPRLNKPEKGAHYYDKLTGIVWEKTGMATTSRKWEHETDTVIIKDIVGGVNGKDGATGSQGIQGEKGDRGEKGDTGIGVPGPQGIQGIKGDTGSQGIPGTPGRDGVCPSCPPTGGGVTMAQILEAMPFIVVTPNGTDDTANLQAAVDASYVNGKNILLSGVYRLSNNIKIKKDHKYLSITGWAELRAINSNVWTFFYTDLPTNNVEAEGTYTMRRIKFSNLVLKGQSQKQSGFELQASEGIEYSFIWGYDLNTLNTAAFALRNFINYNEANGSLDGIKLISGEGRWPNATSSNSCSNGTTINSFRAYTAMNTNTAITVKDVSNVVIDYPVIEGFKVNTGIDYNATSSTSTGADIRRLHYECANPVGNAVVKLRSSTMSHYISAPGFMKQSIFVSLEAAGGYPNVTLSHISSNRLYWNGVDKIFRNAGGNWTFEDCDDPMRQTTELRKMFTGTPVTNTSGPNSVRITLPVNRD